VGITAEAHANAARRMLSEIGSGVVDHGEAKGRNRGTGSSIKQRPAQAA
jgi:hypothetical protein